MILTKSFSYPLPSTLYPLPSTLYPLGQTMNYVQVYQLPSDNFELLIQTPTQTTSRIVSGNDLNHTLDNLSISGYRIEFPSLYDSLSSLVAV